MDTEHQRSHMHPMHLPVTNSLLAIYRRTSADKNLPDLSQHTRIYKTPLSHSAAESLCISSTHCIYSYSMLHDNHHVDDSVSKPMAVLLNISVSRTVISVSRTVHTGKQVCRHTRGMCRYPQLEACLRTAPIPVTKSLHHPTPQELVMYNDSEHMAPPPHHSTLPRHIICIPPLHMDDWHTHCQPE